MSLYSEYIKEREGKSILETKTGFAVYVIEGDECYIEEIFVIKEFRKSSVAREMADEISEIAKGRGCKFLTGTVDPNANASTDSLKILLAYGFELHSIKGPLIVFTKKL